MRTRIVIRHAHLGSGARWLKRDQMMALASGNEKLSFLSLAGYLELHQKGRFRTAVRKYWFWFDEKSCELKYYRNQEAYIQCIHEPVGSIDLRYAKVTPNLTPASKEFYINVNLQTIILVAADSNAALDWIKKLQDKRESWIKATSAKEANEHEKRTLRPLNHTPVGILATEEEQGKHSTVRRIVSSHIATSRNDRTLDLLSRSNPKDIKRHSATNPLSSPTRCFSKKPLSKSLSGDPQYEHTAPACITAGSPDIDDGDPFLVPLTEEEREKAQLEHECLQSQSEVMRLQKDMIKMRDKLEKRDNEILELNTMVSALKEDLAKTKIPHADLQLENESLRDIIDQYKRSLCTLDSEMELHKLHEREHEKRIRTERQRVVEMEKELNKIKSKYVGLLSDKFKITLPNPTGPQELEEDPEEEKYSNELLMLLKQEGGDNPVFDSYRSKFEDQYGDLHDWQASTSTHLYLCRQLYLHYTQVEQDVRVQEWKDYLSTAKIHRNATYWELPVGHDRSKKREFRNLLRKGVPIQYRTRVWTSLVYRLVGKMKDVKDPAAGKGNTYYQSLLLSSKPNHVAEKQIKLDLYRTLPNNRHFKMGGAGSGKLENILIAYSVHNKNIGYCQGMNMLVAIALLFLDEETAFWFLVAIIEKMLPSQYYNPGLHGAQADQAVLRELLPEMLPHLHAHLQEYTIDVTLVTFNWFLTLFIDAMPTESILRIMDTFLFEGSKVLFRISLAILKLNERRILNMTDPVTIFQCLKELTRQSFDVEELLNVAFHKFKSFPNRSTLKSRHEHHLAKIRAEWNEREKERESQARLTLLTNSFVAREQQQQQQTRRHLAWECGCVRVKGEGEEEAWLCCGERQQGRVGIVTAGGFLNMEIPKTGVDSRVICAHPVTRDIILLGTLDFFMHAINCETRKEIWSLKMNDSVLDLAATDNCTVFAALADGLVAVIQNVSDSAPDTDPLLFRVGSTAVSCLALPPGPNQTLWCGCGKSITIMCASTFEPVQSLVMGDSVGNVYKMTSGHHGVWVTFRSTSVVSLFDSKHYIKLMQLDYTALIETHSLHTEMNTVDYRITSLMSDGSYLWLGTGGGRVHIFSIAANVQDPQTKIQHVAQQIQQSQQPTQQRRAYKTGGLLSKVVAEGLASEESPEPVDEIDGGEAGEGEVGARTLGSRYYDNRRRTKFGKTLRRDVRGETSSDKRREPAIFQLVFEASNQVIPSKNDPVRVLVPLRHGEDHFAISCVHSLTEWERGVQVWRCQPSNPPSLWTFGYLPSYEVFDASTNEGNFPSSHISDPDHHTQPPKEAVTEKQSPKTGQK